MTDSQYEPLTGAPREETIVNMRTTGSESSRKAYKVAGFTVLACLLIAGQALTAYFALNQKSQIGELEKSNESLKKQLHRPSGGNSDRQVINGHMYNLPAMMDDSTDEMHLKLTPSGEPTDQNNCKTATAGSVVPGFYRPQCDENGNFLPMQCWSGTGFCWCVDNNGLQIEGSLVKGKPKCVNSVQ